MLLKFAEFIQAINSFVCACLSPNNLRMNKQHPAIDAYRALRKQEPNIAFLHFALMQQSWLEVRSVPEQRPSDYAMALLRAMAYAFLLSQGFSEHEVRDQLVEVMESFEREYGALAEFVAEDDDRPMVRTRRPGSNVILFPQDGRK